jgi:hypothetical protein
MHSTDTRYNGDGMLSGDDDTIGSCFGFAVRSTLPFHYLRQGDGEPMHITASSSIAVGPNDELVLKWRATPGLPDESRLYRDGSQYRLWAPQLGWFLVDTQTRKIVVPDAPNTVRREERLWGMPALLCFLARGDLQFHAAAVQVGDEAIILAAPGAFGKTTLAAAFLSHGYRLLSEDVTCVRTSSVPSIIPGPAVLRLRPDVANRLEIRNAAPVGEPDDRIHLAVDMAARGDCRPVPLRAILLLRESPNGFQLEPVRPMDAVRDLWPLSFNLPTEQDRARCFAAVVDLARSVPVRNLHRPFRFEDLPATVEFVVDSL